MALGNSAGVLFTIKADNSDAKRAFNETEADVKGLGGAMGAMGGPAAIASAAIAAVGAAAIGAAVAIARLTVSTSEFGSKLFDAQAKLGLSAETLSTLSINAEKAGSSFDSVSGSIAKFTVLLGQAENGNEKAKDTLAAYNITAKDVPTALDQAIQSIGKFDNEGQRNAATMALFKDRTGAIIPVLLQMGYSLSGAEAEAKRLGQTMSQSAIEASDDFGDALTDLQAQSAAVGREFALELMPSITNAMKAISDAMAENKGAAAAWGSALLDQIKNVQAAVVTLGNTFDLWFKIMTLGMVKNASAAINWAESTVRAITFMMGPLAQLIFQLGEAKRFYDNLFGSGDAVAGGTGKWEMPVAGKLGGSVGGSVVAKVSGGGGGGGKGGGGAAKQDTEFADAEKRQQRLLDLYKDGYAQQIAENDNKLAKLEINEQEHLAILNGLKIAQLEKEKELLEETLKFAKITADKKIEIEHNIDRLRGQIATQRLENDTAETKRQAKDLEEYNKLVEKFALEQIKIEEAKLKEIERLQELRSKRAAEKFERREKERREALAVRDSIQGMGTGGTDEFGKLNQYLEGKLGNNSAVVAGIEVMRSAFQGLAQAIGSVVQAWVLYGSAGQSVRQVTAQILAGIAQQAAVKAIFELAEGFAALARAFFGDPKAGAEAAMHFKSAAIYGTVAAIAGVAGRGVAGNSFNQAAGGATGSGGNGQQSQNNNFTTPFRGFGADIAEQMKRQNMALAVLEETQNQLARKITGMSPGDVVAIAADENPGAFRTGYEGSLSDDYKTTGGFMRQAGLAR